MAELGDYVTPDGRRVTLPADFAARFQGLQPATPPAIPSAPDPTWTLSDTSALAAATPPAPPEPPPIDAPVTSPAQVDAPAAPGPAPAPRGAVVSPAEDAGVSARAATPPIPGGPGAGPLTNNQLAKLGSAGAYNVEQQGLGEEHSAVQKQGEALANQATAVGNTMAAANDYADKLLQQRQQTAEENARALQAKQDEYLRNAKAVADTRIDRSMDHPVLTALSAALIGLGQTLNRDPINAMKPVYDALERKAAGQMADLDQRRQALGVQREAIGMQAQMGKDRLEQMDTFRLGAIESAKRRIEQIKQQTTSDIVRANSDIALGQLTQKQGQILGGAVQREQQRREAEAARAQTLQMHRESLGMQYRIHSETIAAQREEKAAALAERLLEKGDATAAAKAKLLGEQAIVDPSTGEYMLTPAGQAKMQQADAYEAQARKATDPAQAQKLTTAAQQLRDSAQVNDAATALNKKGAEEAQKIAGVAQNMANNVDAARRMLQAGPEAWNRDQWAQIKVALQGVKVNYAQQMGERMSPKALDAIDEVLSVDPESIWSRTADRGKALAALGTIETQINQSADVAIKGAGVRSGWTPAKRGAALDIGGKTAAEVAADAEPGVLKQYLRDPLVHPIDTARGLNTPEALKADAYEAASARTNAKGQASSYGLDPKDDDQVRALIRRAASAGKAEYGRILDELSAPITRVSKDLPDDAAARPSLAVGIASLIRDEDPKLYGDIIAKLPPLKAKAIEAALPQPVTKIAPPLGSLASKMSPEAKAKYNEYLRSQRLPEVE